MRVRAFLSLMAEHRFRIHPQRWVMASLIGSFSIANSVLAQVQRLRYERRIQGQPIDPAPLFVVGHWRSGTTLLHELLSLDTNFAYSSTIECFLPNHFLISEPLLKPFLRLVLPSKRPMDNMPTGVELPQEDEFALIGLGAPTPYLRIAFANDARPYDCLLNMQNVPPEIEAAFEKQFTFFLKALMLKKQKRLILKSPTHTGRIAWLSQHYPGCRFIHIARNPVEVFLSTKRLWQRLDEVQGFQLPKYSDEALEAMVFECYEAMYQGYFHGRTQLAKHQLIEIQFEELRRNPICTIEKIYQQLQLGDSQEVQAKIAENMQERDNYEAAEYQIEPAVCHRVLSRWKPYAEAFGYDLTTGRSLNHQ